MKAGTGHIEKKTAHEARPERTQAGRVYVPAVDIVENADELTIFAEMPGVDGKAIDIQFENGLLTIRGSVFRREAPHRLLIQEYGVGDYERSFQVSDAIDSDRITAEYAHGVLTVHLRKADAVRPKRIPIKVGESSA